MSKEVKAARFANFEADVVGLDEKSTNFMTGVLVAYAESFEKANRWATFFSSSSDLG
ncbi:hypothetical protein LR48_Vigan01g116500 [Vigna angularis]|uniref:Uncharacterized protein n=1 Tax=Phaseolus angularis TaxID=3914 RepID=A0A0L9TM26_PHAAN|nr:hypothetical protein LR48_Vigan01g116500 [Vigna angularis]